MKDEWAFLLSDHDLKWLKIAGEQDANSLSVSMDGSIPIIESMEGKDDDLLLILSSSVPNFYINFSKQPSANGGCALMSANHNDLLGN